MDTKGNSIHRDKGGSVHAESTGIMGPAIEAHFHRLLKKGSAHQAIIHFATNLERRHEKTKEEEQENDFRGRSGNRHHILTGIPQLSSAPCPQPRNFLHRVPSRACPLKTPFPVNSEGPGAS